MIHLKLYLQCLALSALSFALFWAGLFFAHLSQAADDLGGTALAARLLVGEIRSELPVISTKIDTRADQTLAVVKDYLTTGNRQLEGIRGDLREVTGKLDAPLDAATAVLNNAAGIREDLAPVLSEAAQTAAIARLTIHDLRPQLLGLVAASKVAAGEIASSGREVQRAVPGILETAASIQADIKRTTEASARASAATATTMQNLAKATKPLPVWARVGLAVAPPLVGIGATVVTTLAVTGK